MVSPATLQLEFPNIDCQFSIWDWQNHSRLNCFSNGNPLGSKINEIRFINEDDQALLMTGSSDGVLKIFRNYDSDAKVEIVAAFRALPDLIPSNKNAGLVLDWQQGQGKALVAGDMKVIRVWNAATEVCTNVRHSESKKVYRNMLKKFLGYTCSVWFLHHLSDVRPGRGQYLRRRVWRRRRSRIRSALEAHHCYG